MSTPTKSATGRRKTAVARIRIAEGSGQIVVNGRAFEDYFTTVTLQNQVTVPLHEAPEHRGKRRFSWQAAT